MTFEELSTKLTAYLEWYVTVGYLGGLMIALIATVVLIAWRLVADTARWRAAPSRSRPIEELQPE